MSLPVPIAALNEIRAYQVPPAGPPVDLRLDGNEGVLPPPELMRWLSTLPPEAAQRYPSARALTERLAQRLGVTAERVLVTAGADEAIDRVCRAFLQPGRQIVLPEPTFEMLPRYAKLAGAEIVSVPWPGARYPTEDVLSRIGERTSVVTVVSPNNPTGAVATSEDLVRLSHAAPHALLLVDLAYAEFAEEDLCATALSLPNAVVTRTLSKAWGLAGLRVGYVAGPAQVIAWLRAAGGPYSVASLSLAAAARRLEEGDAPVEAFRTRVREERARLTELLSELGAAPRPSQANFVLARFRDARWVWNALAGLGVAVRFFPDHPALAGQLRITCPGNECDFARLAHALRTALAPQALLFDMDGVLADVSGSYRAAIVATAASFGVALAGEEISAAKAQGNANNDWQLTQRLLAARGVKASLADVTSRFEGLYQGTPGKPGLRTTEKLLVGAERLAALGRKMPLAVVTGRPRKDAERFLDEAGIRGAFAVVVAMEDGPLKPDPAPVRLALRRLGVERAWLLGDTPDDLRAARAADVVPVGIVPPGEGDPAYAAALVQAGASRVLEEAAELEELLPPLPPFRGGTRGLGERGEP